MTLAYYEFDKDSWIHEHAHESEEVWNVVEGTLEITLDGETRTVSGWSAVSVASNVPHAVTALSDGRAIVVDYPRRDTIGGITIGS
jgi:quercetin dioxygenase-like cupin family protein